MLNPVAFFFALNGGRLSKLSQGGRFPTVDEKTTIWHRASAFFVDNKEG
jgi:hypothetical protein